MLLFSAAALVLALMMSLGRGQWAEAILWYALALFFACYGLLFMELAMRWNRLLLILGLGAGLVAFASALHAVGLF